jgi:hypothetical protein
VGGTLDSLLQCVQSPETIKNLWCETDQMNNCHDFIVEMLASGNVTDGSDMVKSE